MFIPETHLQGTVVLHCIAMYIDVSCNKKNNTQDSNVFPHHSTNWSQQCLTSQSRQEAVLSTLYGHSYNHIKFLYTTLPVTYIFHSPLLKECIAVMWWQWSYHFTLFFDLGKMIIIPYVPQSTCIVYVGDSTRFCQCTTTVYSRVSRENGNWFFRWNFPSMQSSFICYVDTCILPPSPPWR